MGYIVAITISVGYACLIFIFPALQMINASKKRKQLIQHIGKLQYDNHLSIVQINKALIANGENKLFEDFEGNIDLQFLTITALSRVVQILDEYIAKAA